MKTFWNQTYDWLQKICHIFLIFHSVLFSTKTKTVLVDPVPNLEWTDTLYGTYSTNSEQLTIKKILF
jgi:hypothetical protein